jgi:hypothetical protein
MIDGRLQRRAHRVAFVFLGSGMKNRGNVVQLVTLIGLKDRQRFSIRPSRSLALFTDYFTLTPTVL